MRLPFLRFREPLLLPFAFLAAGVVLAMYYALPTREALCATLITCLIALIAAWRCGWLITCAAAGCALIFSGIVLVAARPGVPPPVLSVPDNTPAIIEGCVVDPALLTTDREHFTLELAPEARAQVSLFAKRDEIFPDLPY